MLTTPPRLHRCSGKGRVTGTAAHPSRRRHRRRHHQWGHGRRLLRIVAAVPRDPRRPLQQLRGRRSSRVAHVSWRRRCLLLLRLLQLGLWWRLMLRICI